MLPEREECVWIAKVGTFWHRTNANVSQEKSTICARDPPNGVRREVQRPAMAYRVNIHIPATCSFSNCYIKCIIYVFSCECIIIVP